MEATKAMTTMIRETNATTNETNRTASSFDTDQTNLILNLSQIAIVFNFSVEFYIFISLLFYELRTGRFKGKISDPLVIGKIITGLCSVFAMLNLITTEVMILADKFLIQHQYGELTCGSIYHIRPFTYTMAVLAPYNFLWYRVVCLYKVDIFLTMKTRLVNVLKFGIPCVTTLCAFAGILLYFLNHEHKMTGNGCKISNRNKSVQNFVLFGILIAQVLASILSISLLLYPLLFHEENFDEEQNAETKKLVRKATTVSIISLAVSVSVDSLVFVLIWFYPANWIMTPFYPLFDFSVLVKNISVLFFFHEPLEMLFSWWMVVARMVLMRR